MIKANKSETPSIFPEVKNFFLKRGILDLKLIRGSSTGWRTRAKLAVQGTCERPLIGLYKEGTHEVVDMPFCEAHHPKINEAVEKVRQFIREKKIEPYHEETGCGLLRYLQFVVEQRTGKIQLVFVLNKSEETRKEFWNLKDSAFWHSIWLNFNTTKTNTITGLHWNLVTGPELLWEQLAGVDVCFHPASFSQANLVLFEEMLQSIKESVPTVAKIAEFYAGVGVIGLTLVTKDRQIKCCEITPQAEICFREAQKKLNSQITHNIDFFEGLAVEHLDLLKDAEIVIVDPPRKGLDRKLLDALKRDEGIKKIIYVSCGWKSFQRDCDELLAANWKLVQAEVYLFFPGTDHLEILAIFER